MRTTSWLRMLTHRKPTAPRQRVPRRLTLERLEDRTVPSGTTYTPVAAASIHDEPRDGTGDSFSTPFDNTVKQFGAIEERAIVEFDLESARAAPVDLAVLDFMLAVGSQGTPLRTFDISLYSGNGQGDLADFSLAGTRVGTVSMIGSQGGDTYRLDVTAAVQALFAGGSRWVGVRVDAVNESTPSGFYDATLTINGAPAPSGQRGWESVPNAIRMDGNDSFHVEVDVDGAVRSVTLAPFSIYLTPPNPGMVVLRDDGLDGDRVAGDFIYTSGAFRYNTSRTMPSDFYRNDPSSPAGVHIEDVGDVTIEELDGALSTFLVRPAVGLVRADLPLAPSVSVTPNIVTTEHLININTDAQATQRTMRDSLISLPRVTKPIYEQFGDTIDFFMFLSTNKVEQLPRTNSANFHAGMHLDARSASAGTGHDPFDNTAYYGSGGRLQGLNILDAYQRGIWGANATHELVHQWSAFISPSMGVTVSGGHYDNHSSAGSLVGGFQWTPNGDGSYTINFDEGRNGATHASEIDLYMMGLLDASEVDPILAYSGAFKQPGNPVVQASEITKRVTVDDIIARYGAVPPAAQRDFTLAFVAESHNRLLTPVELTFYEAFAAHYTKPVAADQPDPPAGDGWTSIANFFGHGATWSSTTPALRGTTADIVNVSPDPRATAVNQISIVFSAPVTGFDLGDLRLTRDGGGNLLTGAETLSSANGITWTLSGLSGLTSALGNYELTLVAANSGIRGPDGKPLGANAVDGWSKVSPRVTLTINSATLAEAGATASITASLSAALDTDVSVALAFAGTAQPGVDYTPSTTSLTIPAGQTQASLTLTALQDALDENNETVVVDIASVTGAVEDGAQQVTATIADDDPPPSVSIDDAATVLEGNTGARPPLQFVVRLSAASGMPVTVAYATAAGTATSDVDYVAAAGTLTFAPGETARTITVLAIGDDLDEPGETFVVNLGAVTNATMIDGQGVGAILDDDPPPSLSIDTASFWFEGDTGARPQIDFFVRLAAASGMPVTVAYSTAAGTATSDIDYIAAAGTLNFAPGERLKKITVLVIGDGLDEPNETFVVNLGAATNATLDVGQGVGSIYDDDPPPSLSIDDAASVLEGYTGARPPLQFVVRLSAASGMPVTVAYATAAATATPDVDFVAAGGTLSFAPGETTKTITVLAIGDRLAESNEMFVVNLGAVTYATVIDGQAAGALIDDEPRISINDVSMTEGKKGTTLFVFTVTLSAAYDQAVTMSFRTADGTAATGSGDYASKTGTLTFAPGETSKTITIEVKGDARREADETFTLDLFGLSGNALFTKYRGLGTILDDD